MNGYLHGPLAGEEGADRLPTFARQTAQVGKRLGLDRMKLPGTGPGDGAIPIRRHGVVTGPSWREDHETLKRIRDMAGEERVIFCLKNLSPMDHPGRVFESTADGAALVHRPLRIGLDVYHEQIREGDLIRWCDRGLPWIGEEKVVEPSGCCERGAGEIDYAAIALGYRGPVAAEPVGAGIPDDEMETRRMAFTT